MIDMSLLQTPQTAGRPGPGRGRRRLPWLRFRPVGTDIPGAGTSPVVLPVGPDPAAACGHDRPDEGGPVDGATASADLAGHPEPESGETGSTEDRCGDSGSSHGATGGAHPGDAGMSTVEYAVGTVVAAAFAAVLYKIVTGDSVVTGLTNLIDTALSSTF